MRPDRDIMRTPSAASFIQDSVWGKTLTSRELDRVLATSEEKTFSKDATIIGAPERAQFWVGLICGFAMQSVTHADGNSSFLFAVSNGAWFGEGALIRRTHWAYDVVALQETRAVLVSLRTFEWLRETSLPFNHFLQELMNTRLRTYVGMIVNSRHSSIGARVATALMNCVSANQCSDRRYVGITQSELAMLAGTSRQRVNDVFKRMRAQGIAIPHRRGVEVVDVEALRSFARVPFA